MNYKNLNRFSKYFENCQKFINRYLDQRKKIILFLSYSILADQIKTQQNL